MPTDEAASDEVRTTTPPRARGRLLALAVIVLMTAAVVVLSLIQKDDGPDSADGGGPATETTTPAGTSAPTSSLPPSAGPLPSDPVGTPPILESVPLDATASFGDGITASLAALEAVEGRGQGVGEISGPAILVTITLDNGTAEPFSLDAVTVNLYFGIDQIPAVELSDSRMDPFSGSMDAGQSAEGSYVFSVPVESRDNITLTVSDSPGSATVVFSGPFA